MCPGVPPKDFRDLIEVSGHAAAERRDLRRRRHDIRHHDHHGAGRMRRPYAVEGIFEDQAIAGLDPQRRHRLQVNVRMRFAAGDIVPRGHRAEEMIDFKW